LHEIRVVVDDQNRGLPAFLSGALLRRAARDANVVALALERRHALLGLRLAGCAAAEESWWYGDAEEPGFKRARPARRSDQLHVRKLLQDLHDFRVRHARRGAGDLASGGRAIHEHEDLQLARRKRRAGGLEF